MEYHIVYRDLKEASDLLEKYDMYEHHDARQELIDRVKRLVDSVRWRVFHAASFVQRDKT